MRWCAAGFEQSLDGLVTLLEATPWPGPPAGFEPLTPARRMRTVLRGDLAGPDGPVAAVLKWSRPDTLTDRVSRLARGGKGPREGRVLRALAAGDISAPRALAFADDGVDFLVTEEIADLRPAPEPGEASAAQLRAAADLLVAAHAAGLRHPDLHRGNLGFSGGHPLLVDLGGARMGPPLADTDRVAALGRLRHGLMGGARRSQRFRALVAYMETVHGAEDGRGVAREFADAIEREAALVARRYRLGRDRRATRDGRHFATFSGARALRGIRRREGTDATWERRAEAWLADVPPDATPLKAGGDVLRTEVEGRPVVVKRFGPVLRGRLPHPLRAFRRAFALENRHVAVPRALMAAARGDGSGICASAWIDAPHLLAYTDGGRGGDLEALPAPRRHRSLERLGRALRAMHDAWVSHRDLKAPNLLAEAAADGFEMRIADLEGVRIRRRPVSWARRARDLARLDASLDALATDRLRVLHAYMRVLPRPPVDMRRMAERIAAHVRRKRGPSGAPR